MQCTLVPWTPDQFGLRISLTNAEIDALVQKLMAIRMRNDDHFHLTHPGRTQCSVRDIEISVDEQQFFDLQVGGLSVGKPVA